MELVVLTQLSSGVPATEAASSNPTNWGRFDAESNVRLFELLGQAQTDPERLLDCLCENPEMKTIYDESTGYGNLTVRTHTVDVLRIHAALAECCEFEKFEVPGIRLQATFTMMLALHDARKAEGGKCKTKQHQATVTVLTRVMAECGFLDKEIHLAAVLVGNGFIGDFLVNKIPIMEMKNRLDLAAVELSLSPKVLFRLSSHYYTVDAGAYPHLRRNPTLFVEDGARISIAHPSWKALENFYL